jgi:hypothetical protein
MVNPIFKLMNKSISTDAVNNLVDTPPNNISVKMPGTTTKTTTPLSTPDLMTDAISNKKAGYLADVLAETQNYYGGEAGIRSGIRHAIGSSYLFQDNPILSFLGKHLALKGGFGAPTIADDKDLDLWYHPDGPQMDKIKSRHWTEIPDMFAQDIQTITDKTNNRIGVDQLSGLSFEERYKKMTGLMKEQLEHFAETGTFKRGLPVWNTEGEGTFETKGIIKTPEDAKKQLKVIAKGEEDLIDDRRMGSLRNKGDLSDIEQLMERSREEYYTKNINEKNKLKEKNKELIKHINNPQLADIRKKLEKGYDRNLNDIENLQKKINKKELKPAQYDFFDIETEPWAKKVIEEQKFLESKTK